MERDLFEPVAIHSTPRKFRTSARKFWLNAISFPEPTCLLVSTKTRSSGIINFQRPILVPRGRTPFGQHQETSGLVQRHSVFEWLCKHNRLRPEPIRFVKIDSEHTQSESRTSVVGLGHILVPRGRAPFGQHQELRPLAWSNTGSPRFTDFPSLCACSESSLTNLIGSGLNLLCFQSYSKPECRWTGPEVAILSADQKERGLWGRDRDLARGRDSWCWPKGARPLGTRMPETKILGLPASRRLRGLV